MIRNYVVTVMVYNPPLGEVWVEAFPQYITMRVKVALISRIRI
jgi:hypothetical protein